MKKKVILIDIDDVVGDLLSAWLKALNDKYGTNVSNDEITDWELAKFFPTLTNEQIFAPLHSDAFWKEIKLKSDAEKYVKRLFVDGYDIFFCTSTDYRNICVKYEFLIKKYFPYINWDHVIVTHYKQMIKADYLIDDGVHNLENGEYTKILMSAPHNKNYNAEANGMIRANSWKEIYEIIYNDSLLERY
jgi:5'-nucleotidase